MNITRILVPVDFSEQSERAAHEAARMAQERNAQLTLLHVHEIVEMAFMDFSYVEPPTRLREACDAAEARLRKLGSELATPAERVGYRVVTGSPTNEIIRLTDDFDLVVMPTHGRTGLSHFLLGSVAERVVRGAHCSVLIVKEKAQEQQKAAKDIKG